MIVLLRHIRLSFASRGLRGDHPTAGRFDHRMPDAVSVTDAERLAVSLNPA
jgi:hypothetical protein